MSIGAAGPGASLGSAHGEILIDIAQSERNVRQLQGTLNTFGASAGRSFANIGAAGQALAGLGALITGALGLGVRTATNFEAEMSAVGAVTNATGAELESLRAIALKLGADTSFSASEAAAGLEELGKAGVSTKDILDGAAAGALNLAAASGIGVPQAAILMANALNVFSLAGSDATHVADLFAAAANTSAADADGLGLSLSQVGTVANQFGLSLEDTVGALALFADQGLKGSDAGTSLKTALLAMLTPAGIGAKKIAELGISFRDANGDFIGLAGAADELRAKLGPLSRAERDAALQAIFGTDAIRVGAILYGQGGDAVEQYTKQVNDAGAAQDASSKRLDNLKGSLEQLKGSVETAGIVIGSFFLPFLRELVDAGTALVNAFLHLPESFQLFVAVGSAVAGIVALISGGFLILLPRIAATIKGFSELRILLAGLSFPLAPILAIGAALAALGVAYKINLFGFGDAVNSVFGSIKDAASGVVAALGPIKDVIGFLAGAKFEGGLFKGGQGKALEDFQTKMLKLGVSAEHVRALRNALTEIAGPLRELHNTLTIGGRAIGDFVDILSGKGMNKAEWATFEKRLTHLFGAETAKDIRQNTKKLRTSIVGLGDSFKKATGFDLSKWISFEGATKALTNGFILLHNFLLGNLIPAIGPKLNAGIELATRALTFLARNMDTIVGVIRDLAGAVRDDLAAAFDVLAAILSGDFSGAWDAFKTLIGNLFNQGLTIGSVVVSVGSWLLGVIPDIWDWLKGVLGITKGSEGFPTALPGMVGPEASGAKPELTIREVLVNIGGWALGQVASLWKWLQGLFGTTQGVSFATAIPGMVGPEVGSSGITLTDVLVNIANWAIEAIEDIGTAVSDFVTNTAWPAVKDKGIDLADVLVNIESWAEGEIADLWEWLKGIVGLGDGGGGGSRAMPDPFANSLTLTDVPVNIVSWALGEVADLWDWLKGALGFGASATGFGGMNFGALHGSTSSSGLSLENVAVSIGSWLLSEGESLAVKTVDFVTSLWPAIRDAGQALSGYAVSLSTWVIGEVADGTLLADTTAWVQTQLATLNVTITDWHLTIGSPGDDGIDIDMAAIGKSILNFVTAPLTFEPETGEKANLLGQRIGQWAMDEIVKGVKSFFGGGDGGGTPSDKIGWDAIVRDFVTGLFTPLGDAISNLIRGPELNNAGGFMGVAPFMDAGGPLTQWIDENFTQPIKDALRPDMLLNIEMPSLPDWVTDPTGFVSQFDDFIAAIRAVGDALKSAWEFVAFWQDGGDVPDASSSGTPNNAWATPPRLPGGTEDTSESPDFQPTPVGIIQKVTLDRTELDTGLTMLGQDLKAFAETPTTAKVDADIVPAFNAMFRAFSLGNDWANSVFTARFDINTAALDLAAAHVAVVAQQISDLMPHSPARTGPLSRPISFGYIADNLVEQMRRLKPAAEQGLVDLVQAFKGATALPGLAALSIAPSLAGMSVAPTRGGDTFIDQRQFYSVKSDEYAGLLAKAERGDQAHQFTSRIGQGRRTIAPKRGG